jgi:EmrB/QacA subfamily drug resistance transporter
MAFGMFAVIVALPKIMTAFGTSVNTIQWIMTGYLIARAVPTPAIGWLVSLMGKRRLFLIGVLGVTVCSALSGLAWSIETLILFRVLQGFLGAPVMAVGMVLLYDAFPPHRQGAAMGLLILAASLGPTIGQLFGGYLVDAMSWRAIFFLCLPSGVASIALTMLYVPSDIPNAGKHIDVPGVLTMGIFLATLLLGLSQGQHKGWDSGYIIRLWGMALISLGLFVLIELRSPHPVVHLRLYRHLGFIMASLVVFLYSAGFMGANFLIALMLQLVFDFTPVQSGLILAPGALVMGLTGFVAGKLSDRIDPRWLIYTGLLCFIINLMLFASLHLAAGVSAITFLVILRGGFGMIHSSINTAVMRTLPEADRSMGSGLHNLHRGIGMSFGVALCSLILEKRLAVHTVLLGQQHDWFALPIQQTLAGFQSLLQSAGSVGQTLRLQTTAALKQVMQLHVHMAAYTDCFIILALIFVITLGPVWLIRARTAPPEPKETTVPVSDPAPAQKHAARVS